MAQQRCYCGWQLLRISLLHATLLFVQPFGQSTAHVCEPLMLMLANLGLPTWSVCVELYCMAGLPQRLRQQPLCALLLMTRSIYRLASCRLRRLALALGYGSRQSSGNHSWQQGQ